MDVTLDDLDWCLDRLMSACPAYLMALPTKIDPMLGYLTTGYQDHLRLRQRFNYRADDQMRQFFRALEIIDERGQPTDHFGDPRWVYLQYRRRKHDARSDAAILDEGRQQMAEVRDRGVFLTEGHGERTWQLASTIDRDVRRIYDDAKISIWKELDPAFIAAVPSVLRLTTRSADRQDYILHPNTGERLADDSVSLLNELRRQHAGRYNVQIVVSDGLNALSIMDPGHLDVYLEHVRRRLGEAGFGTAPEHLLMTSGRVRAGYRVGEELFGNLPDRRAILHVIGERPGTGHHTFSIYITAPAGAQWGVSGRVDHDVTKVVSGVASTALAPSEAAIQSVRLLQSLFQR